MSGRILTSLYALVLHAFPKAHRGLYGDEMVAGFRSALEERRRAAGRLAAGWFALVATGNAMAAGWGERRRVSGKGLPGQRGRFLEGLAGDLRYATRALLQVPMFSFVCTVSLGLGLGAVFTIALFVNFLSAVPVGVETDGLVEVVVEPQGPLRATAGGWVIETWSYPDYEDLRSTDTGLSLAGWSVVDGVLGSSDVAPLDVAAMFVTPGYFNLLGVEAARGRMLAEL